MRAISARSLILVGIGLAIAGFGYDLLFAGLPYQDPTAEKQQAWLFHKMIGETVFLAGVIALLAGVGKFVWSRFLSKERDT